MVTHLDILSKNKYIGTKLSGYYHGALTTRFFMAIIMIGRVILNKNIKSNIEGCLKVVQYYVKHKNIFLFIINKRLTTCISHFMGTRAPHGGENMMSQNYVMWVL